MRRLRVLKGSFLAKQHVYETYKRARKQGHKKGHTTTTKQKGQPCRPSSLLVCRGGAACAATEPLPAIALGRNRHLLLLYYFLENCLCYTAKTRVAKILKK